jgi:hypothetical protein
MENQVTILPSPIQERQWEENHKTIMDCMHKYMQTYNSIPTLTFIGEQTGLSRPTIRKHLRGFSDTNNFKEHASMFKLLSTNVLRQLYTQSMQGNVQAARLYMELMGVLKYHQVTENNFMNAGPQVVKFYDIEITNDFLDSLSPGIREKLEAVLKEGANEANASES